MDDQSPSCDVRLDRIEADLRRMAELADQSAEREARLGQIRNPRLARCVASGTYPEPSDNPDTYYIIFLDSTFTEAEGDQTPTHTDRQSAPVALAHDLTGEYIPEDEPVIVLWDNGRWWIVDRPFRGPPPVMFSMAKMRRQSDNSLVWTITCTDPGTWQLSAAVRGNATNSHVTRLTASAWNDPCLRLDRTGMWSLTFQHKIYVDSQSPHNDEYDSESTGEADGHYHSYEKFNTPLAWEVLTTLESDIDEVYFESQYNRTFMTRWNQNGFFVQTAEHIILDRNAGSNLRITTQISHYNHAQVGVFTCAGYLICRWLGPRSE